MDELNIHRVNGRFFESCLWLGSCFGAIPLGVSHSRPRWHRSRSAKTSVTWINSTSSNREDFPDFRSNRWSLTNLPRNSIEFSIKISMVSKKVDATLETHKSMVLKGTDHAPSSPSTSIHCQLDSFKELFWKRHSAGVLAHGKPTWPTSLAAWHRKAPNVLCLTLIAWRQKQCFFFFGRGWFDQSSIPDLGFLKPQWIFVSCEAAT